MRIIQCRPGKQRRTRLNIENLETRSVPTFIPPISIPPLRPPVFILPQPPALIAATAISASQINLTWSAVPGASSYLVEATPVSANAGSIPEIFVASNPKITSYVYPLTKLNPAATYSFSVAARTTSGESWSSSLTAITFPSAPTFAATAISPTQIVLSWSTVPGANGYIISGIGGLNVDSYYGKTQNSVTVGGLDPGNTYEFFAAAYNSAGATWANGQTATLFSQAFTFTATAVSQNRINLNWNVVPGAARYLVDEVQNGEWVQIADLDAYDNNTNQDVITGLNSGTTYEFNVAAVNSSGTTWAGVQSATTAPGAPLFTHMALPNQINLYWDLMPGATGYIVDELNSLTGTWVQLGTVVSPSSNTVSWAVTGLSASTSYTFRIAAYNAAGATWAGSQSASTLIADPAVPQNVSYSAASGPLFGSSGRPSYTNVQEGKTGDCWLLASLAEVAARDPQDIENMFTYDGATQENGATVELYTVRFFDSSGSARYVEVDTELPDGGEYYDQVNTAMGNQILWVALAEKAYAEANGLGYVTAISPHTNSYAALNLGYPSWALNAITGIPAGDFNMNTYDLVNAWGFGDFIVLSTGTQSSSFIVDNHCYAVVGYNANSSEPFELFNAWGTDSSDWAPGKTNQVYGLFDANSAAISAYFDEWSALTGPENAENVADPVSELTDSATPIGGSSSSETKNPAQDRHSGSAVHAQAAVVQINSKMDTAVSYLAPAMRTATDADQSNTILGAEATDVELHHSARHNGGVSTRGARMGSSLGWGRSSLRPTHGFPPLSGLAEQRSPCYPFDQYSKEQ